MTEETSLDVLIAVYLIPDLAKQDFDAVVKLIEDQAVAVKGVVLVSKDAEGEISLSDAGDHRGRRPQVVRKAIRHVVAKKIGDQLDQQLPPGSAGVVAVYDHAGAQVVDKALANAIRKSTSEIDQAGAKQLKEGLAEAGAGLSG